MCFCNIYRAKIFTTRTYKKYVYYICILVADRASVSGGKGTYIFAIVKNICYICPVVADRASVCEREAIENALYIEHILSRGKLLRAIVGEEEDFILALACMVALNLHWSVWWL